MAKYQITSPDGKAFVVNAPDGATQDQVLEYAKSQWAKSNPSEPAAVAVEPEFEDPGMGRTLLIGAGRTFDRVGKGMQQLYYGARGNEKELAALKESAAEDDRAYKPLQEARPFATGIGESIPSMVIPGGGAATWTGNALRMGASAAVPAMLEYGDAGDRLLKGVITGGSAAAIPALGVVAKSAKTFAEPLYSAGRDAIVGRTLNRISGDDAANVIQRLKAAQPLVPGSVPTAAQVARNGGIAAMERSAAGANPSEFAKRGMEQASARLSALRGIAGDDVAIAAATRAREAATKPSYDAAKAAVYEIDPSMKMTMQTPIMKKAIARAKQLAENNERPFIFSTETAAPFASAGGRQGEVKSQITGQALQDIKTALDDLLIDPTSGVVGSEAKTVERVRGRLVDWMEKQNPEFKAARTTYAQMSQPINQMQVGQALLEKLKPALSDYGALGKETAANFAGQLRNSETLMRNATGFKGIGSLESVMGPQNMGALNGIAQDLARKANSENLGRGGGSDTFQKLAMQNIAEQSGMPRLMGGLLDLPVVSRAAKWVYRDSDEAAQKVISDAMLDPKKAAQLMEQVDKGILQNSPKLKQALLQSGMRVGGLLGMASAPQE